jgi:UDP-N-acetylmuramoyl-L-alanyl-D-glutamate--2,6-diaminopimelate ligase
MRLSELTGLPSSADPEITGLTEDSRRVGPAMVFVAVPGTALDGHAFVADAISRGAVAIVAERDVAAAVPVVRVPSARSALAEMAARFYGHPARELDIIGFTGTFGKTSTSDVLRQLLDAAGRHTGILGSLGARYGSYVQSSLGLTTPAPVELHAALRGLRDAGADTVIMEVTSHALRMDRVRGLTFAGGMLAAIMPGEHTDFHRTYDDYVEAKRLFLDYLSPGALLAYDADNRAARMLASEAHVDRTAGFSLVSVLPVEDLPPNQPPPRLRRSAGALRAKAEDGSHRVEEGSGRYRVEKEAGKRVTRITLEHVRLGADGARFTIQGEAMHSTLTGRGHLRNVALAATYALASGVPSAAVRDVLGHLAPLRRRMERYQANGREILDDTAAHPESFRATFETVDLIPHSRAAAVYAIRGNRGVDINRRNALALADLSLVHGIDPLIVTASEDVAGPHDGVLDEEREAALNAIASRGQQYVFEPELDAALRMAMDATAPGDLVLLLGAQGMDRGRDLIRLERTS